MYFARFYQIFSNSNFSNLRSIRWSDARQGLGPQARGRC